MPRSRLPAAALLALLASACGGGARGSNPAGPESAPLSREDSLVVLELEDTIDRVSNMAFDDDLVERAAKRGLQVSNVAWEDTGRAVGTSLGPNITDLTLQVRRKLLSGEWADALMPVLRYPNFSDHTADVPADRFFLRAGNARGEPLRTVPLLEVLQDLRLVASDPRSLSDVTPKARINVFDGRDTHFLVSAQAVFLPIPKKGQATFHPVVFNYQSAPESPAVLVLLATREGTSVKVIENRPEDLTVKGWGQELYFNDHGSRAAFTAERRSDVKARIDAQGGPRTEADKSALGRGADVIALIQVPLKHDNRGLLGGALPSEDPLSAGGFGPNDATIRVRPGPVAMERAVVGHGPRLGPFVEGYEAQLVRDPQFPIRITIQFYKATSDGVATDADLDAISKNIESAYEHADDVGSLVIPPGDPSRPTAWQSIPGEWFPW